MEETLKVASVGFFYMPMPFRVIQPSVEELKMQLQDDNVTVNR